MTLSWKVAMSRIDLFFRITVVLVGLTLVSRLIGFLRQVLMAGEFGLGWELDAYVFAFQIPSTLFLILPGAVNAIVIPVLKGMTGDGLQPERNRLFHKLATLTALALLLLAAAGMIWAQDIIRLLAPDFSPEKRELAGELLAIMMPSVLFIGLISLATAFLNAHDEFVAPSVGPILNGLMVIASIYLLAPFLGIRGIAWGTLAGFAVFALSLVAPMLRRRYTFRWNLAIAGDPVLRGMGERFVPILIGLLVSQLYLFMEKILAGGLGDSKLSALWLAFSMVQLPIAIFSGALAVPLFPLLSEYVKRHNLEGMKQVMARGFLYQYHVLLPATVGLILLAEPFVRAFYGHGGKFGAEEAGLTAWAVIFYTVGMVGWAGRDLLTRASYALEDTKKPVFAAAAGLLLYIPLSFALMPGMDHGGLALAYALATYANLLLQAWWLRRRIGRLFAPAFYASLGRGLFAAAAMGAAVVFMTRAAVRMNGAAPREPVYGALKLLPDFPGGWTGIGWLAGIAAAAAVLYFGILLVLGDPYVREMAARVKPGGGKSAKEVQ